MPELPPTDPLLPVPGLSPTDPPLSNINNQTFSFSFSLRECGEPEQELQESAKERKKEYSSLQPWLPLWMLRIPPSLPVHLMPRLVGWNSWERPSLLPRQHRLSLEPASCQATSCTVTTMCYINCCYLPFFSDPPRIWGMVDKQFFRTKPIINCTNLQ